MVADLSGTSPTPQFASPIRASDRLPEFNVNSPRVKLRQMDRNTEQFYTEVDESTELGEGSQQRY